MAKTTAKRPRARAAKSATKILKDKMRHEALGDMMDLMMNAPLPGQSGFVSQLGDETEEEEVEGA